MREWVFSQLKHCSHNFIQYENTMKKSIELINGLYVDDLVVELLIAPTQFGKTSTIFWTAYNLMTHIDMKYFVPYPYVFIMTGLNSNSWKDQTKSRVLPCMQENVWHNKDLCNVDNVERLKDAVLSDHNALIIIDEVHVGTKLNHVIFNTLLEFHPDSSTRPISQSELFDFLHAKRVKFLLVSATPDAIKETMENNWIDGKFNTVTAYPDSAPSYVWHKDFLQNGRVHQSYSILENTKEGVPFSKVLTKRISKYSRPLYHMIRFPIETKKSEINLSRNLLELSIKDMGLEVDIVMWDAKNTLRDYFKEKDFMVFENDKLSPSQIMKMTNEDVLKERPRRHTIFILKELFRVAQTLPIDNIGLLVDRDTKSPCDSTLSQSLIGRACGHNKHQYLSQIHIYTHIKSVMKYIKLWENGFDYAKVPDYKGNGVEISKDGKILKSCETILGQKVKRKIKNKNDDETTDKISKKDNNDNQDDTFERLERVSAAYKRSNGVVRKIIEMFKNNDFQPVSDLGVKNPDNYNKYGSHHKLRIVEKKNGLWNLRNEIRQHLDI